jgi:hypothetical protein
MFDNPTEFKFILSPEGVKYSLLPMNLGFEKLHLERLTWHVFLTHPFLRYN